MKNQLIQRTMILALTGLASAGAAQSRSRLDLTVSLDGINWSTELNVDRPDRVVQVRAAISFEQNDGTQTPVGFASLTWQPTASNWRAGDQLLAFADRGNNSNGGSVLDTPGNPAPYGRITPFASTGPTTSDPYRGHVQASAGTNYLRIARTSITNWVGDGATTGTAASNNFNGSGGLACVQKSSGNVNPTVDPPFRAGTTDIVLFKYAVQFELSGTSRTVTFAAPLEGMSRNATTGNREAAWFLSGSDNFGAVKTLIAVNAATVHVVPGPAVLGAIGLAGIVASRRRRC